MSLIWVLCLVTMGVVIIPKCESSVLKEADRKVLEELLDDLVMEDNAIDNKESKRQRPRPSANPSPEELVDKALKHAKDVFDGDQKLKQEYYKNGQDQESDTSTTQGMERQAKYTATAFEKEDDKTTFYVAAVQKLQELTKKPLAELNKDTRILNAVKKTTELCSTEKRYDCSKYDKSRYRTIDGTCNNLENPHWGKTAALQNRFITPPAYDDNINTPRQKAKKGGLLPSARDISNDCLSVENKENVTTPKDDSKTIVLPAFGQFLDHDFTLTPISLGYKGASIACCDLSEELFKERLQCFPILMTNDWFFKPRTCLDLVRSSGGVRRPKSSDACQLHWREQLNAVTSYIDASNVYGSDATTASNLRAFQEGLLLENKYNGQSMLPATTEGCDLDNVTAEEKCFLAGDERVNEVTTLSVMHTTFMREHNRLARKLFALLPAEIQSNTKIADDLVYHEVRKIIGAYMQIITYREWLPEVIGDSAMAEHKLRLQEDKFVYKKDVDATIKSAFSTAAFRYGHTTVENYMGYFKDGKTDMVQTPLTDVFFKPALVYNHINNVAKWATVDTCQKADEFFVDNLRNKLFLADGISSDLASLNIQRGRDHGLPPYVKYLQSCFSENPTSLPFHSTSAKDKLLKAYSDVDDIDLFVGGISETTVPGGSVGKVFACLIGKTFRYLREGDRYWYQNKDVPATAFTNDQIEELEKKVTLARVLCKNHGIDVIQKNVFREEHKCEEQNKDNCQPAHNPYVSCDSMGDVDLVKFKNSVVNQYNKLANTASRSLNLDGLNEPGININAKRRPSGYYGKH